MATKEELWSKRPFAAVCDGVNSGNPPHDAVYMKLLEEDYGSLGSGGSYERRGCPVCNYEYWSQLPD